MQRAAAVHTPSVGDGQEGKSGESCLDRLSDLLAPLQSRSGGLWSLLWGSWLVGHLKSLLGVVLGPLETSWGPLGTPLGSPWDPLGNLLGASWSPLGSLLEPLGAPSGVLESPREDFGALETPL